MKQIPDAALIYEVVSPTEGVDIMLNHGLYKVNPGIPYQIGLLGRSYGAGDVLELEGMILEPAAVACLKRWVMDGVLKPITSLDSSQHKYELGAEVRKSYPYMASKTPIPKKAKYRIMVVVPHIYLGGGETQMEYLLDKLQLDFHITIVVVNTVDDDLYPIWAKKYDIVHLSGIDKNWALQKLLTILSPDAIIHHGCTGPIPNVASILPNTLQGMKHKPVIVQIAHTGFGPWTTDAMTEMKVYNDHVVTVADWLKHRFASLYPQRFTTVLNGVPVKKYSIPEKGRELTLGIMSRLVGGKGLDALIDVMPTLPKRVRLVIAGWGDAESSLRRKASSLGDRVVFMGTVIDRSRFFDAIDCAILPSDAEGNSMFLLEAAMASKPIITTNVGAVPELFKHNHSVLITDGSPGSIKHAVSRLMSEVGIKERLSKAAHTIVSTKATAEIMAQGYSDVIMSEIRRRQDPRSILCFREDGRGDLIMVIPVIKSLRQKFPAAKITFLLPPSLAAVIDGRNLVDEIIAIDGASDRMYQSMAVNYDLAIHFRHDEVWDTRQPIVDHYLEMVGSESGAFDVSVDVSDVCLPRKYNWEPYVCIHASSPFECKNWGDREKWGEVVEYLQKHYNVLQIGGSDQYDLGVHAVYKEGLSPVQTMKLLDGAEFFIGIDSFPVHAARAVGCESIVIYGGASNPEFCGYPENTNLVPTMDCACQGSKAHMFICTKDYACLDDTSSKDVIQAVRKLEGNRS